MVSRLLLPHLKVAIECHQDWNAMPGDQRVRFCGRCSQNVYNIESLRPREVAALFVRHGDRLPCLRLLRRPDGTVVMRGCLARVRAGVRAARLRLASVVALAM